MTELLLRALDGLDDELSAEGLNVAARLSTARLAASSPHPERLEAASWPTLLLWASAGPLLWSVLEKGGAPGEEHPIDTHVERLGRMAVEALASMGFSARLLFPHPGDAPPFPVGQAGQLAGLGYRSRMGLSIHPQWGLWLAYRLVIAVDRELPETPPPSGPSPCLRCVDTPCVTACPVAAVGGEKGLDGNLCLPHRVAPESSCAASCLSRLACPVGQPHRYPMDQIAHHHAHTHAAWRAWFSGRRLPSVRAWEADG